MVKLPVLFSLANGEFGRFLRKKRVTDSEVDVLYYPAGAASILSRGTKKITRVPASAVSEPLFPPGGPEEGIVLMLCGHRGESWLADKMGLAVSKDIARLEKEKAQINLESQMKDSRLKSLRKGVRSELKDIKESRDVLEKPKRRDDFGRRRLPPELEDEYGG